MVNEKVTNIEDVEDKKLRIAVANTILKSMKSFSGKHDPGNNEGQKFETEEMLKDLNKTLDSGMLTSSVRSKRKLQVAVDQIQNKTGLSGKKSGIGNRSDAAFFKRRRLDKGLCADELVC